MICDTCVLKDECQGPKDIQAVKALTWRSAIPASICYAIDEAFNNFSNCEYYEEEPLDKPLKVCYNKGTKGKEVITNGKSY